MKRDRRLNRYIFTFGCGQKNAYHYQEIYAKDFNSSRALMINLHGYQWSSQYDEAQWELALRNCPSMRSYTPVGPAIYEEDHEENVYPVQRDLDGAYFRVKRDGKFCDVCFSDLNDEEMDAVLPKDPAAAWSNSLCKHLAERLRDLGDSVDAKG